jgi:hypothetical protein
MFVQHFRHSKIDLASFLQHIILKYLSCGQIYNTVVDRNMATL